MINTLTFTSINYITVIIKAGTNYFFVVCFNELGCGIEKKKFALKIIQKILIFLCNFTKYYLKIEKEILKVLIACYVHTYGCFLTKYDLKNYFTSFFHFFTLLNQINDNLK